MDWRLRPGERAVFAVWSMAAATVLAAAGRAESGQRSCTVVGCSDDLRRPGDDGGPSKADPILRLLDELTRVAIPEGGTPRRSLFLSGGGSHGAWGAGVLYGRRLWRATGEPELGLVTGVSAGSLMATLIFVDDYEELKKLYAQVQESDIQRLSPYAWSVEGALYSRKPLRRLVECALQEQVDGKTRFQRAEEQHLAGRRLLVGTPDLVNGAFCAWNMG